MNLDSDEKKIVTEAIKIYAQLVMQRAGTTNAQVILSKIKSLSEKIESDSPENSQGKLKGLTDEQFENVCKNCEKFINGCTDVVAKKFPGKCDPILKYEHNKLIEKGQNNG